jgi:hypothetical protein
LKFESVVLRASPAAGVQPALQPPENLRPLAKILHLSSEVRSIDPIDPVKKVPVRNGEERFRQLNSPRNPRQLPLVASHAAFEASSQLCVCT